MVDFADMVLSDPLSDYLPTELRWLSLLFEAKQRAHTQRAQAAAAATAAAPVQQQQLWASAAAPAAAPPPPPQQQGGVRAASPGPGAGAGTGSALGSAAVGAAAAATTASAAPPPQPDGDLSVALVLDLLSMNEEAVGRCLLLSAPGQAAASARQLFHSSTRRVANTGCLLEQVASHMMAGLGLAVDACVHQLLGPFSPAADGSTSGAVAAEAPAPPARAALERTAAAQVGASVGRVLRTVAAIGAAVKALQVHYRRVVAPAVAGHSGEARACLAGLAALARAVDERVAAALQRALALLANQLDLTLVAAQRPSDFLPDEAAQPSLDAPTHAATLVCALVRAAAAQAGGGLHGPNLASFRGELGRRLHAAVAAHMLRQTYSPMGGLRWRRDLQEYAAAASTAGAPAAAAALAELQGPANLLVVAPDSLLGLADGALRLSRRAALRYVALRQDFRTARLAGDRSLEAAFSGEA